MVKWYTTPEGGWCPRYFSIYYVHTCRPEGTLVQVGLLEQAPNKVSYNIQPENG